MTVSFITPMLLKPKLVVDTPRIPPAYVCTRLSPATLAVVALAHISVLAVLMNMPDATAPVIPPQPLTVNLIEAADEEIQARPQPKPKPQPPKPQPPKPTIIPLPPPVMLVAKTVSSPTPLQENLSKPDPIPVKIPEVVPSPAQEVVPSPTQAVVETPQLAPPPLPIPPRPADYLNNPKPPYPALSKRLGEEGTVRLKVLVNADGNVAQLEVTKSSGYARLDQSALNTVPSWKFVPAHQGGKPIAGWITVPIQFTLRS